MVTHEPDIVRHAQRVVSFRDGRLVKDEMVQDQDQIRATDILAQLPQEEGDEDHCG